MSAKHTPGTWRALDDECVHRIYTSEHNLRIADVHSYNNGHMPDTAERAANARLMAAAPTLLAELVAIVALADAEWEAKGGLGGHPGFDAARAAIKAATGEPS